LGPQLLAACPRPYCGDCELVHCLLYCSLL
jgi:hypothetical protein